MLHCGVHALTPCSYSQYRRFVEDDAKFNSSVVEALKL